MKVTIYTVPNCQFSNQEKEYLKSKGMLFEEKNLESNREFLTEMLAVSNNFAGTPVTKVEKDDGQIVVLKGFTKDELDREFSLSNPVADQPTPTPPVPPTEPPAPSAPAPEPIVPPVTPEPIVPTTPVQPVTPPVQEPATPVTNDALASILADLQKKAEVSQTPASNPTDVAKPTTPVTNVPDFQ